MSSPRLPVEIVSISILSRLPSFIAEPLPNARSIWASAASSAFCRSMPEFSNVRASIELPMIFNCAAMFPVSPIKSNPKLPTQADNPPSSAAEPRLRKCVVSYLFLENNRGTSIAGMPGAFQEAQSNIIGAAVTRAFTPQSLTCAREVGLEVAKVGSDMCAQARRARGRAHGVGLGRPRSTSSSSSGGGSGANSSASRQPPSSSSGSNGIRSPGS